MSCTLSTIIMQEIMNRSVVHGHVIWTFMMFSLYCSGSLSAMTLQWVAPNLFFIYFL